MKIIKGNTRHVFLVGTKSIKLGRVRTLRAFSKLVSLIFSKRRRNMFFSEYGSNFLIASLRYIFIGIWANRNEFYYYQKHKDSRVMPTLKMFCCGLIVIQERGEPVTTNDLNSGHPLPDSVIFYPKSDLQNPRQYGLWRGKILVVDYGNKATCDALIFNPST